MSVRSVKMGGRSQRLTAGKHRIIEKLGFVNTEMKRLVETLENYIQKVTESANDALRETDEALFFSPMMYKATMANIDACSEKLFNLRMNLFDAEGSDAEDETYEEYIEPPEEPAAHSPHEGKTFASASCGSSLHFSGRSTASIKKNSSFENHVATNPETVVEMAAMASSSFKSPVAAIPETEVPAIVYVTKNEEPAKESVESKELLSSMLDIINMDYDTTIKRPEIPISKNIPALHRSNTSSREGTFKEIYNSGRSSSLSDTESCSAVASSFATLTNTEYAQLPPSAFSNNSCSDGMRSGKSNSSVQSLSSQSESEGIFTMSSTRSSMASAFPKNIETLTEMPSLSTETDTSSEGLLKQKHYSGGSLSSNSDFESDKCTKNWLRPSTMADLSANFDSRHGRVAENEKIRASFSLYKDSVTSAEVQSKVSEKQFNLQTFSALSSQSDGEACAVTSLKPKASGKKFTLRASAPSFVSRHMLVEETPVNCTNSEMLDSPAKFNLPELSANVTSPANTPEMPKDETSTSPCTVGGSGTIGAKNHGSLLELSLEAKATEFSSGAKATDLSNSGDLSSLEDVRCVPTSFSYKPPMRVAKIQPELGTISSVVTSCINSPSDFYLQLERSETFAVLQTFFTRFNSDNAVRIPSDHTPVVYGFYLARFPSDSTWYRAQVLLVNSEGDQPLCLVCYIDYGNVNSVPVTDLAILDDDLANYPPLAFHCSLSRVRISDHEEWGEELIQQFQSLTATGEFKLQATFEATLSTKSSTDYWIFDEQYAVKLGFKYEGTQLDIADFLKDVMGEKKTRLHPTSSVVQAEETIPKKLFSESGSYASYEPDSKCSTSVPSSHNVEGPVEFGTELLENPFLHSWTKDDVSAYLSHAENPTHFFVHLEDCANGIMEAQQTQMNNSYEERSVAKVQLPLKSVTPGSCWAYKLSDDQQWYRVRVLQLLNFTAVGEERTVRIIFVDWGNELDVPSTDLRPLLPEFTDLPCLAVPCSLAWVSLLPGQLKWSPEVTKKLIEMAGEEKLLRLHVDNQPSFWKLDVVLWAKTANEKELLVNTFLIEEGFATARNWSGSNFSSPTSLSPDDEPATEVTDGTMDCSAEANIKHSKHNEDFSTTSHQTPSIGTFVYATVSSIFNPAHFYLIFPHGCQSYLQVQDEELKDEKPLGILNGEMTQFYEKQSILDLDAWTPKCNSLVAVRSIRDKQWLRATILDHNEDSTEFNVFYVDYGTEERVQIRHIRKICSEFTKLPRQAVECFLRIKPIQQKMWSKAAQDMFEDCVKENTLLVKILQRSECGKLLVQMFWKSEYGCEDIGKKLVENMLAIEL